MDTLRVDLPSFEHSMLVFPAAYFNRVAVNTNAPITAVRFPRMNLSMSRSPSLTSSKRLSPERIS